MEHELCKIAWKSGKEPPTKEDKEDNGRKEVNQT